MASCTLGTTTCREHADNAKTRRSPVCLTPCVSMDQKDLRFFQFGDGFLVFPWWPALVVAVEAAVVAASVVVAAAAPLLARRTQVVGLALQRLHQDISLALRYPQQQARIAPVAPPPSAQGRRRCHTVPPSPSTTKQFPSRRVFRCQTTLDSALGPPSPPSRPPMARRASQEPLRRHTRVSSLRPCRLVAMCRPSSTPTAPTRPRPRRHWHQPHRPAPALPPSAAGNPPTSVATSPARIFGRMAARDRRLGIRRGT